MPCLDCLETTVKFNSVNNLFNREADLLLILVHRGSLGVPCNGRSCTFDDNSRAETLETLLVP